MTTPEDMPINMTVEELTAGAQRLWDTSTQVLELLEKIVPGGEDDMGPAMAVLHMAAGRLSAVYIEGGVKTADEAWQITTMTGNAEVMFEIGFDNQRERTIPFHGRRGSRVTQ